MQSGDSASFANVWSPYATLINSADHTAGRREHCGALVTTPSQARGCVFVLQCRVTPVNCLCYPPGTIWLPGGRRSYEYYVCTSTVRIDYRKTERGANCLGADHPVLPMRQQQPTINCHVLLLASYYPFQPGNILSETM